MRFAVVTVIVMESITPIDHGSMSVILRVLWTT
jgi:hypothetical protein